MSNFEKLGKNAEKTQAEQEKPKRFPAFTITGVAEGGAAYAAGLRQDDLVVAFCGGPVPTQAEFEAYRVVLPGVEIWKLF